MSKSKNSKSKSKNSECARNQLLHGNLTIADFHAHLRVWLLIIIKYNDLIIEVVILRKYSTTYDNYSSCNNKHKGIEARLIVLIIG